jgi:hypothetical protein
MCRLAVIELDGFHIGRTFGPQDSTKSEKLTLDWANTFLLSPLKARFNGDPSMFVELVNRFLENICGFL